MKNVKHFSLMTVLLSTVLWTTPASASILGIYFGASAGQAEILDTSPKQDDTATKVYAGYRILGPIAVEVSQINFGEYYSGLASISGTSLDAMLYLPAGLVNIFAKVGYFAWKVEYTGGAFPEESGSSAKAGFGVEYNIFANIDFRLEWEQYKDIGDSPGEVDMNFLSAGINIAF